MTVYQYSVIRITPNPVRAESINVGVIIVTPEGPDVRILESMTKIKAISSAYTMDNLKDLSCQFDSLLRKSLSLDDLIRIYKGNISLSPLGTFRASNEKEYDRSINEINRLYISPEKSKSKLTVTQKRILTELKNEFNRVGILGKSIDDIDNHKVVHKYPLAEDEGLYAELLLKNGAYHLTETLDFRSENLKQKMGDSALKAITMDTAKHVLKGEVKTFLVYAAEASQSERLYSQQLNLIDNYADNVFNLLSDEDMSRYFDHMFTAAGSSMKYHA